MNPRHEPFTLDAQPEAPARKPVTEDQPPMNQRKLFAGADCFPGQLDLWNPDGKEQVQS